MMTHAASTRWLVLTLATAGLWAACGGNEAGPAGGSGGASPPAGAGGQTSTTSGAAGQAGTGGSESSGAGGGGAAGSEIGPSGGTGGAGAGGASTGGGGVNGTGGALAGGGGAGAAGGESGGAGGSAAVDAGADVNHGGAGGSVNEGGTRLPDATVPNNCSLPAKVSFANDVQPFFIASCGGGNGCHILDKTSTTASGGFNHGYDWITAGSHASSCPEVPNPKRFEIIIDVIHMAHPATCSKSRQMPPPDATGAGKRAPLTPCQEAAMQAWLNEPKVMQTHRADDSSPTTPYLMPPFN